MNPQHACTLVAKLEELFQEFAPAQRDLVQGMLEKYPDDAGEAAICRLAEETSNFDRGRLRTLLFEEHGRRSRPVSPTAGWRASKEAEVMAINEILSKMPKRRLQGVVDDLRKNHPDLFRFLRSDPLESDLGKSLIYIALKDQGAI